MEEKVKEKRMRYKKVRVKNYKAILDLTLDFSERSLIPLIGLNETGKSSILEAIFAFDRNNDIFNEGRHVSYNDIKNKYETLPGDPEIIATIEIPKDFEWDIACDEYAEKILESGDDSEDDGDVIIDEIETEAESSSLEETKVTTIEEIKMQVSGLINQIITTSTIEISRNLRTKEYRLLHSKIKYTESGFIISAFSKQIEDFDLLIKKIIGNTIQILQYSIYLDDFNDRVPAKITSENKEWYNYIAELFKRTDSKYLMSLFKSSDRDTQLNILSDVNYTLNEEVTEVWKNMHRNLKIKDEIDKSYIELNYDEENKEFHFSIKDSRSGKERRFNIEDRSKGFQWFFNFVIKVKYNHKYVELNEGSLFLLDEPGSYLHTNSQYELLKNLKDISKSNIVIYCTHLENLVNPSLINPKNIEIVRRKKEKILIENFAFSKIGKDNGSLAPIYNALKLNNFPLDFYNKNVILTEGMSDYLFLKLLQEKIKFSDREMILVPGFGADQLTNLLSLITGLSKNYTLILDGDDKGKESFEKYKGIFGEYESKKWIVHDLKEGRNDLEGHYTEKMKEILLNYSSYDLKNAMINFYYEKTKDHEKEFINEIKKDIQENGNIKILIGKINKKLKIEEKDKTN